MRYLPLLVLATALSVGCGGGGSSGPGLGGNYRWGGNARFDGTFGTAWEPLPAATLTGCPGFTDYTPAGETGLFCAQQSSLARFTSVGGWTSLASPPIDFDCWPNPAWVGKTLYVIRSGGVYAYDTVGGSWTNPVTSGVADTTYAQMAHDDDGHVFALEASSPYRIVRYTIATNAVDYLDTGGVAGADVSEPRMAWDPTTGLLYIAPAYYVQRLFSFDPAAPGSVVELAGAPSAAGGLGTGMGDPFCGDRSGHLYAIGDTGCSDSSSVFQYDIATDTWIRLPDLPVNHGCNGSCTVSDEGWLYITPGDSNFFRIQLN